jgi:hypothetical protein
LPGERKALREVVAGALLMFLSATLVAQTHPPVRRPTPAPATEGAAKDEAAGRALAGPERIPPPLSEAQEDYLLSRQRALTEEASAAVGHSVELLEDEQFIFLSDLPAASRRKVMGWLGALYRNLDRIFLASKEDMRMWDGKLVVVVFFRRADYLEFALTLQGQQAAVFAGGYFQPAYDPASRAMTATVVVPLPEEEDRLLRLRSVLVHECTHAFLYYWKRPGRTPLWLHEGTAVHMQAVADPKDPQTRALRQWGKQAAADGEGYPITFATEGLMPQSGSDSVGYGQALAMTETLLAADTKRYVRFVRLMKEGVPQKEALAQAFNWSYDTFDRNWRRYARTKY